MFKKLISLFEPLPNTIESNMLSRATTPDRLVVEAIVSDMVRDIKSWVGVYLAVIDIFQKTPDIKYEFRHGLSSYSVPAISKKDGSVKIKFVIGINHGKNWQGHHLAGCTINGIEFDRTFARYLLDKFRNTSELLLMVEKAAAAALAKMEQNEAKWNLAETLLGMKRNEFGALVPVVKMENNDEHARSTASPSQEEQPALASKTWKSSFGS